MPDYRLNPRDDPDYDVSAATASRYRQVVDELLSKHGDPPSRGVKRKRQQLGRNRDHNRKFYKVIRNGALGAQALGNGIMLTAMYTGRLSTIV